MSYLRSLIQLICMINRNRLIIWKILIGGLIMKGSYRNLKSKMLKIYHKTYNLLKTAKTYLNRNLILCKIFQIFCKIATVLKIAWNLRFLIQVYKLNSFIANLLKWQIWINYKIFLKKLKLKIQIWRYEINSL